MLIVVTVAFVQVGFPPWGPYRGLCRRNGSFELWLCSASHQEYRSEKSLEELTKLVPPECNW